MIRNYQPQDRQAVLRLFDLNTPAFFDQAERMGLENYLEDHGATFLMYVTDDEVLACGGYLFPDESTAMLAWGITHPHHHGLGYGRAMVAECLKRLQRQGLKKVVVRTSQFANGFLEKFGFTTRQVVKDYWAPGFDLYHMELGPQPEE